MITLAYSPTKDTFLNYVNHSMCFMQTFPSLSHPKIFEQETLGRLRTEQYLIAGTGSKAINLHLIHKLTH